MEITNRPLDLYGGEIFGVDKPLGWTSFDAVKRLRGAICRRTGKKKFKVGHAGTLDPLATGVLIICTGKATKQIESLQAGEKEYVAHVKFGATTPSFDLETEIDHTFPYEHITPAEIEKALTAFTGRIMQIPPAYSAVKVDGKRAYKSARKGKEVELKPKELHISTLELLEWDGQTAVIRVVCSKGTYIRALARDLGEALGSGAHLTALQRTRVGRFALGDCLDVQSAVDMIATGDIIPPPEE